MPEAIRNRDEISSLLQPRHGVNFLRIKERTSLEEREELVEVRKPVETYEYNKTQKRGMATRVMLFPFFFLLIF